MRPWGWALIQYDGCPYKRGDLDTETQGLCFLKGTWGKTGGSGQGVRRQLSASQGERPQEKPPLMTPWFWTSNIYWVLWAVGHCSWCFTHHLTTSQQPYKVGILLPPLYRWGGGTEKWSKLQLEPRWSGSRVHTLNQLGIKKIVKGINSPS